MSRRIELEDAGGLVTHEGGADRIRLLKLRENQGKGGAVQQGMLHARGEMLLMVDADGVLKIPPGVAHGCRCLSATSHLLYVTSRLYDPEDEGRIAHDDPRIGFDWTRGPAIK